MTIHKREVPDRDPRLIFSKAEITWTALAVALTAWGLVAVGLAQLGMFRAWAVTAVTVIACATGWGTWRLLKSRARSMSGRETMFLALLFVVGSLLYCWPSEEFPQNGDASIYTNTTTMLLRTGGLTYHYAPLDGLTAEQKELFYIPADRQLSNMEIESYEGLLYGVYYVMDPDENTIVSSRPPLAIVWMGLLGMVGGERGMLYVTPLFGTLSLVVVYFLGKRLFGAIAGAVAAMWLLLSFPQLYFSRTSYAEVVGEFFVLAFLYAVVSYWQTRQRIYIAMGLAALTAAFAARIDVILALPTLLFFLVLLALQRDWKAVALSLFGTAIAAAFTTWTINRPYVGATAELLLVGQLKFLGRLPLSTMVGVVAMGLGGVALLIYLVGRMPAPWQRGLFLWGLAVLVAVGVSYALWIRPLFPEYVRLADGSLYPTHNEEILATTARYVSPLLLWLAAGGVMLIPWRKRLRLEQILLVVFVASFAGPFFWKYTTARVYPVALRRILPEVLPGLSLFGASVVHWLGRRPTFRWMALGAAGLTAAMLVSVSGPYWHHRGSRGALDLLDTLAEHIPPNSVVLFESGQEDSIVGWFASPLWSTWQENALLLNDDVPSGEMLDELVCQWQRDGKAVYVIAQHDPTIWWPGGFSAREEGSTSWNSSIIGQSLYFPPFIWHFDFQFRIYQWDGSACPTL